MAARGHQPPGGASEPFWYRRFATFVLLVLRRFVVCSGWMILGCGTNTDRATQQRMASALIGASLSQDGG
jgi:hypothetical protein